MNERPPLNEHPFTAEEQEVVFAAWALKARDKAFVPMPEYLPAAESMATKGWLRGLTLENGDVAYEFTDEGESTLTTAQVFSERSAAVN